MVGRVFAFSLPMGCLFHCFCTNATTAAPSGRYWMPPPPDAATLIEDAVEALFRENGVPYIRTGSHNQGDIATRFEVRVTPAPDFVVFDNSETLRAILECKGTNDGGTARDKALRFAKLRGESNRLGGIPLIAVLGGIGWARVNDALGPVVRDTDGRVFTLSTLSAMLEVAPFPSLVGLEPTP